MKKTLLLFLLCAMILPIMAEVKKEQRIYLWDVTLSMKGYKGRTPNIYDDVVDFMTKDIRSIKEESTIIKVAPFQEGILKVWTVEATAEGKECIIDSIKKYKNKDVTDTDIMSALCAAEKKFVDPSLRNQIILLTDGKHNDPELHERFVRKINGGEWERFAENNNAFLRYVALIDMAKIDGFEETEHKTEQEGFAGITFADLYALNEIKYNIKDKKPIGLYVNCSQDVALPALRFQISCNDSVMHFKKELTLVDGKKIEFTLDYDYEALKKTIPEEYVLPLSITLLDREFKKDEEVLKPILHTSNIDVILINRPEKSLTIKIKK